VLLRDDLCSHVVGLAYSTRYEDRALGRQSSFKANALSFETAHSSPRPLWLRAGGYPGLGLPENKVEQGKQ
jgi:hypothetical protein